jgi:transcriptional regulator with GAF, ATPase, and Fis domain
MSSSETRWAEILRLLVALGRTTRAGLDPRHFLEDFSACLETLVPHDRLVIDCLEGDGEAFTVFAEHVTRGPVLHEAHYTTAFDRSARYVVTEWAMRRVFAGEPMLVHDFSTDPRFADANPYERRLQEAGVRSGLLVPLRSSGRVIGALVATSLEAGRYTEEHRATAQQVAELVGPFVENVLLLERERRRRRRLQALHGLTPLLGASLDVRDVFARLADELRPILDFDVMGASLISSTGRDIEILAEVNERPVDHATMRLDEFSFADRVEAGDVIVIRDARVELSTTRAGDRLIVDNGGRSVLCVPLRFADRVEGALYFGKRQPDWFDATDVEIAGAVAAQVVLALQHQRLAEEQRRLAAVEGRARRLAERLDTLRSELGERYGFDRIIGRSRALREALDRAAKVASTDTTVLLTGESGTGKELVARAIHHASARADGPFVALNCAALPETLLESELFGHERGAFTGADRTKPGRFELATGGTLFLDEVAELSPAVQAKLLRVLQEREFQRVGGTATLKADVRLVAATNRELMDLVADGRFREDLYYRLNVFTVHLPPLRERGDDVLLLAAHFARELGTRMGKSECGLARDARDALAVHRWPGNIRELSNAIERALILSDGGLLTAAQLGLGVRPARSEASAAPLDQPVGSQGSGSGARGAPRLARGAPSAGGFGGVDRPPMLSDVERRMVTEALERARGNRSHAARLLGLTRSQLYTRLKRFGLA